MVLRLAIRALVGALACLTFTATAADLAGTVTSVQDGDTLTFSHSAATYRVRLVDIDAPESNQPFGAPSTASLRELCESKSATLEGRGTDRYGRVLARVTCGGVDANAEQVRRGLAWVFERYAPKDSPLRVLEQSARQSGAGLWVDKSAIPPWVWRRSSSNAR